MDDDTLTDEDRATLIRLGFEPRYLLCRHPGWPDPLDIWPPTPENAQRTWEQYQREGAYIIMRWEKGPRTVVYGTEARP